MIIYYTHFQSRSFKKYTKMMGLSFLKLFGVRILLLENNETYRGGFVWIPDWIDVPGEMSKLQRYIDKRSTIGKTTFTFLVCGYIEHRKCVGELINALDAIKARYPTRDFQLRVIGEWENGYFNEMKSLMRKHRGYLLSLMKKYVSDEQLLTELAKSDCVIAVYRRHVGSSGIVNLSIGLRKRVLFVPSGYLGQLSNRLEFTGLPQSTSASSIALAINEGWDEGLVPNYSSDKAEEYVEERSLMNFKNAFYGNN